MLTMNYDAHSSTWRRPPPPPRRSLSLRHTPRGDLFDLSDLFFWDFILPSLEFRSERRIGLFVCAFILGVDLTLSTLTQEVADELPQHCGPSLFANFRGLVKLGEEVFVEENLHGSHVAIVSDREAF